MLANEKRVCASGSSARVKGAVLMAALGAAVLVAVPNVSRAQGVLRIAAVVNEDVISAYDVENRIRLVMLTSRLQDTPETRQRLVAQVLRNLIDEHLQMQEAKRLNVEVSDAEVEKLLTKLNDQNGFEPGTIERTLERNRVDLDALRDKVRAEQAWVTVVRRKLQRQISIGNEEVEEELQRLRIARTLPRRRVAEILLSIDKPENEGRVRETANRLIQQIRAGARFDALAREFSQSASAAVGGDLGWVTKGQLDQELESGLTGLRKGEVAGPIRTIAGYYILLLVNNVAPATADGTKTRLDLSRLMLPVAKNASEEEWQEAASKAREIRDAATDCASLRATAKELETKKSGDLKGVTASSLPPQIRDAVAAMKVGQTTKPLRTPEGLLLVTLCARKTDPSGLPGKPKIRQRLANRKFNMLIQRYMRDLRRTAFVDIRG